VYYYLIFILNNNECPCGQAPEARQDGAREQGAEHSAERRSVTSQESGSVAQFSNKIGRGFS
jgi:hypothetical protein